TNHLDLHQQLSVLSLLRELASDGLAVLLTLHDLRMATEYCDAMAVLHRGRLVATGTPESVLSPALLADVFGVPGKVGPGARGEPDPGRVGTRRCLIRSPPRTSASRARSASSRARSTTGRRCFPAASWRTRGGCPTGSRTPAGGGLTATGGSTAPSGGTRPAPPWWRPR